MTNPNSTLRVAIFGLGYVGSVCGACLAALGHKVVGVDPVRDKVDALNRGRSPVVEPELDDLTRQAVDAGSLRATTDPYEAVTETDLALLCVGTPSQANGSQDRSFLTRVSQDIGSALRERRTFYGIVVRSTVLPGTVHELVAPTVEAASGKRCGVDFGVGVNPEFLREGSAVRDFHSPAYTVVGTGDERLEQMLRTLYARITAPFVVTEVGVAEMLKFVSNSFHALKVTFANEVGTICKALGVDARAVMELFAQDRKLNISDAYLRPGFAFGGSCLPKDLRAINYLGRVADLEVPVLQHVPRSNELHIRRAVSLVERGDGRRVGILGLAFKSGTDDLRESPMVELAETLLGKGYDLRIFDPSVDAARLVGANKRFIDAQIPHLATLLTSSAQGAVTDRDVVIVAHDAPEFRTALATLNGDARVIDLADIRPVALAIPYEGIAW